MKKLENRLIILTIGLLLQSCAGKPLEAPSDASGDPGNVYRSYERSQSKGDVKIFEQVDYYKVSPASKKDLIPSLIRSSPIREKSDGYLGQTQTRIKYEIDYLTDSEVCWVDGIRVQYHVVFVLPTLISNDNAVRGIWSEWFPKLLKHEHNHRDIGLGIANEINDKLNGLLPEKTCEALLKSGEQIVSQLEDKEDVLHTKYDQETNHGQTEGLTPRI